MPVTSARERIPEDDRARNMHVLLCVQKIILRLTHTGGNLQCISFGVLSDVRVVLGMRKVLNSECAEFELPCYKGEITS